MSDPLNLNENSNSMVLLPTETASISQWNIHKKSDNSLLSQTRTINNHKTSTCIDGNGNKQHHPCHKLDSTCEKAEIITNRFDNMELDIKEDTAKFGINLEDLLTIPESSTSFTSKELHELLTLPDTNMEEGIDEPKKRERIINNERTVTLPKKDVKLVNYKDDDTSESGACGLDDSSPMETDNNWNDYSEAVKKGHSPFKRTIRRTQQKPQSNLKRKIDANSDTTETSNDLNQLLRSSREKPSSQKDTLKNRHKRMRHYVHHIGEHGKFENALPARGKIDWKIYNISHIVSFSNINGIKPHMGYEDYNGAKFKEYFGNLKLTWRDMDEQLIYELKEGFGFWKIVNKYTNELGFDMLSLQNAKNIHFGQIEVYASSVKVSTDFFNNIGLGRKEKSMGKIGRAHV